MKKYFLGLLLMIMLVPSLVLAKTSISVESKEDACVVGANECEKEVHIYIETDESITTTDKIIGTMTRSEGVEVARVVDGSLFHIERTGDEISISPKEDYLGDGKKTLIGTIVFKYASNIEDCSVKFTFASYEYTKEIEISTGKPTQTGISLPVAIIGTISLLGIGAYIISRKSPKFYSA